MSRIITDQFSPVFFTTLKHDGEEERENEISTAGWWMGMGRPFFGACCEFPHPWHREVVRRAIRRIPTRFQSHLHRRLMDASLMLLFIQLLR